MQEELFLTLPGEPVYGSVLLWGLSVVRFFQKLKSPVFTPVMAFVSNAGIIMIVVSLLLIFWCFDQKKGFKFGIVLLISSWVNSLLKTLLKQPRPFSLDSSLGLSFESSYGFPSGHAQMSLVFACLAAFWLSERAVSITGQGKKIIFASAAFFALLMAFTRVYLGVHFPTDIAGGWLAAGILLFIFFKGESRITKIISAGGIRIQFLAAAVISFLMLIVYPEEVSLSALFFGFSAGYALICSKAPFFADHPVNGKKINFLICILRFAIGVSGAALIFFYLGRILPGAGIFKGIPGLDSQYKKNIELGHFLQFGILGFWLSCASVFLFQKLRIAESPEKEN